MSYGMHNYLTEKTLKSLGMRKHATATANIGNGIDPDTGENTDSKGYTPLEEDITPLPKLTSYTKSYNVPVINNALALKKDLSDLRNQFKPTVPQEPTTPSYLFRGMDLPAHPMLAGARARTDAAKAALDEAVHKNSTPGVMAPPYLLAESDKRGWLEKGYSRIRDWVYNNPQLAMDMLGTSVGATLGASLYKKNRFLGGAAGGITGLLASVIGRRLYNEYNA